MELTQDKLKAILKYNPEIGIFKWLKNNKVAGGRHNQGYENISIKKKRYLSHRLAWLYIYGYMPNFIDHINGNRKDNRIKNLRSVNRQENQRNMKLHKSNKSGFCGVCYNSNKNKWRAYIVINNKQKSLGVFKNKEEAIKARMEANILYGFHPNHGKKKI